MHIRVRYNGQIKLIPEISKRAPVKDLKKKINELFDLPAKAQRLLALGKQLEDGYDLFDFGLDVNCLVDVIKKVELPPVEPKKADKDGDVKKVEDEPKMEEIQLEDLEDKENSQNNSQKVEKKDSAASSTSTTSSKDEETAIKLSDIYDGDVKDLGLPEVECKKCKDVATRKCKECGCNICAGKDRPDVQLMCDECEYCYHIDCLDPPLESIPDGDWYCPVCKNDENEVVMAGQKLKIGKKKANAPSYKNMCKRDWGNGFATAGRTKSCTKVPANHFGPIPGIDVGMSWLFRIQISEEGIHRPPVAGIAGRPDEGAVSIVLAGGYEDDVDNGDEFFYTGAGGRDLSGNKRTSEQAFDQELNKTNLAIAKCCACPIDKVNGGEAKDWTKGKPIRVVRSAKLAKHSKFAPEEGNRYDGIYKVVKYWPQKGQAGFLVWRYLFRRDDPAPAPWTEEGQANIEMNGYKCIKPEGHEEAMAAKAKAKAEKDKKAGKGKGKGKGRKRKNESEDEKEEEEKETKAEVKVASIFQKPGPASKKARKTFKIPQEAIDLMDKDERNAKLWTEVKTTEMSTKLDFTDCVETHFSCLCCQEIVCSPVTTPCGHNTCLGCLKRAFKADCKTCPSCRANIEEEDLVINKELQDVMLNIFPGYDKERA